jgi:hypothetical protein
MYGLSEYLLAMQDVEKARLADRARKTRQGSEPPSAIHNPRSVLPQGWKVSKEVATCSPT